MLSVSALLGCGVLRLGVLLVECFRLIPPRYVRLRAAQCSRCLDFPVFLVWEYVGLRGTLPHRRDSNVFMPEHVHLVMLPRSEDCTAAPLLSAIKRPMSFQYKKLLEAEGSPLLKELTIRERPGKLAFRFWQEGPGHDANLDGDEGALRALWYVHNNPVKRGLCAKSEEWAWSSARQYKALEPMSRFVPRVVRLTDRGAMWDQDGALGDARTDAGRG